MSDPISFSSTSARHNLPLLFTAQAQKELFVNEALSRLDGLLHIAVEGEADTPPLDANDGEAWIVGSAPTGSWENHADELAMRQQGNWFFAIPADGMTIFDKAADQSARYAGQWVRASSVAEPSGGGTVDTEARSAINAIKDALVSAGILPNS